MILQCATLLPSVQFRNSRSSVSGNPSFPVRSMSPMSVQLVSQPDLSAHMAVDWGAEGYELPFIDPPAYCMTLSRAPWTCRMFGLPVSGQSLAKSSHVAPFSDTIDSIIPPRSHAILWLMNAPLEWPISTTPSGSAP